MAETTDETIPVALWYDEVEHSTVEACIKEEIGYNLATLEVEYSTPSEELIAELAAAANGNASDYLDSLMGNHLAITEAARAAEKAKTDRYKEARRQIISDMYTARAQSLIDDLSIAEENVLFVSKYSPLIICDLTTEEIASSTTNSGVNNMNLFEPLEIELTEDKTDEEKAIIQQDFIASMNIAKSTMVVSEISNLNLTGEGIAIGNFEPHTVSPAWAATYGLSESEIEIVGPVLNIECNSHSAFCSGISAGDFGIAPGATLKSTTTEYDYRDYITNNQVVETLTNFEDLIDSGVSVINISWRIVPPENTYNDWARYTDYLVATNCITVVASTGNSLDTYVGSPASGYNTIGVSGFHDEHDG